MNIDNSDTNPIVMDIIVQIGFKIATLKIKNFETINIFSVKQRLLILSIIHREMNKKLNPLFEKEEISRRKLLNILKSTKTPHDVETYNLLPSDQLIEILEHCLKWKKE